MTRVKVQKLLAKLMNVGRGMRTIANIWEKTKAWEQWKKTYIYKNM